MQPDIILCTARAADGRMCGETTEVREVHYRFTPRLAAAQVLTEIRYDVNCPICGHRTQVERIVETVES